MSASASGVVAIGRKQYAVGLYWENSPSGHIAQAAVEAAKQSSSPVEFFVTRPGNDRGRVPQFGLAPKNVKFKAGLPSLAGTLATQQPGSWIGAFRFEEGTAIIILRDDLIVPDGDLFFPDENEARDRLFSEIALGGFQRIYAPETWGVPNSDGMPVALLLNDRADTRLRTVAMSSQAKAAFLIGGVALVLAAGIGLYIQDKMDKDDEAFIAQMQAIEQARRAARDIVPKIDTAPVYPPPERTWEKEPLPLDLVDACRRALEEVSLRETGWRLVSLDCDKKGLTVNWARQGGFTSVPEKSSLTDSAGIATRIIPLPSLPARGTEYLLNADEVTRRYLAQNWPGGIARVPDDPLPKAPAGHNGEWAPPPKPWVKRSFTITVPVLPWTLPVFFADLPGVVINQLVQNGERSSWSIEGEVYENRR